MTTETRVLVTGGAGYIGSHVVLALKDRGIAVEVADDLSTGRRALVPPDVPLHIGDIGDDGFLGDLFAPGDYTAVMHFAGSIVVPESVTDPLGYYRNNTCASRTLIARCVGAGIHRFIFSSTAAVYGIPDHIPVTEDAPTVPINPYGTSKLMTEWMLRDTAAATGLNYVALRYFNVAGADPAGRSGQATPRATHLIKVAAEVITGKRDGMEIFGTDYETPDGTCVRDYIHVTDLAAAHVAALRYLERDGENATINCGYGRGYSVREVLDAMARVSGIRPDVRESPRRAGDPPGLIAGNRRIGQLLDWKPAHDDLDTIVGTAIDWERGFDAG